MRAAAIICVVWACATSASAQDHTDTLFVTGQADFLPSGNGATGAIEWLRKSDRRGVQGGMQSGSRPNAWWTYGRAGGFSRLGRLIVSGALDAGGGVQTGARFGYQKLGGQVGLLVAGGRFLAETEVQLAHLAPDIHRVVRVGGEWRPTPQITAGASYYAVSLRGATTPGASARVRIERGRAAMLGGAVFAQRQAAPSLLTEIGPRLTATEFFAGGGVRTGSARLQIVANVARTRSEGSRLLASLEVPLKR